MIVLPSDTSYSPLSNKTKWGVLDYFAKRVVRELPSRWEEMWKD